MCMVSPRHLAVEARLVCAGVRLVPLPLRWRERVPPQLKLMRQLQTLQTGARPLHGGGNVAAVTGGGDKLGFVSLVEAREGGLWPIDGARALVCRVPG